MKLTRSSFYWSIFSTVLLWIHAQLYRNFLSDDALISMRYSERLLEGHGLTWTDGIPVEGYSNLLWVLLTAGLGALGIDLVDAVRLLGFICNASVIFAIAYLFNQYAHANQIKKANPKPFTLLPLAVAQLFWALSGSTAVWTMGGLEQPLVVAGLVWAVALIVPLIHKPEVELKKLFIASIGLAVVVLTRPDGPLFTAVLSLLWWLARPKTMNNFLAAVCIAALPLFAFLSQLGFRLAYYGDWVPNTAHVKAVITPSRIVSGVRYSINALATTSPFLELIVLGTAISIYKKQNKIALYFILIPAMAWIAYISSVGGDIFPAFRHGLLVYGLMSLAILVILINCNHLVQAKLPVALHWCLVVLCFTPFFLIQVEDPENKEAFYEQWEWDGQAVGETLHAAFEKQQPLYAVTAAGSLPYWSKLPVLDMLGLNDYHIARNPPADFGHGELGHDLGDGKYVLEQKPELISFCGPYGAIEPCRLSGKQMVQDPHFAKLYQPLFINIQPTNGREEFTNIQWIRWQDSSIGFEETETSYRIPGYLAATSAENAAILNEKNLIVKFKPGQTLNLPVTSAIALNIMDSSNLYFVTPTEKRSIPDQNIKIKTLSSSQITLVNNGSDTLELKELIIEKPLSRVAIR